MKRVFFLFLVFVLLLSVFSGCESDKPAEDASSSPSAMITKEEDGYFLNLPTTKEKAFFQESEERYIPMISDELVKKAEEKILEQVGDKYEKGHFYLTEDQEGFLCLGMEIIVEIEPPKDAQDLGCNVDHKHLFYKERITK